jgi:hypothetical protein
MIKFFRSIRQDLLEKSNTGKYIKYALGEIVLVVIGILIALSINSWNEGRKETKIAREILLGIKNDLKRDNILLDSLIRNNANDISLIHSLDPAFKQAIYRPEKYQAFFIKPDTSMARSLFYRGISFRPIRTTYSSMIADGRTSLIRDRDMFEAIQQIYDERHHRISSVYETMKPSEDRIHWNYGYEKKNWTYRDLQNSEADKIFLDLFNFVEIKYFYSQHLFDLKEKNKELIALIDLELNP